MNTLSRCILIASLGLVACAGPPSGVDDLALRSARIDGIEDSRIELEDGVWEGEPFEEDAASRPRIGLIEDYALRGGLVRSRPSGVRGASAGWAEW